MHDDHQGPLGYSLRHADESLKEDKDVVFAAVKQDWTAFRFSKYECFMDDPDFEDASQIIGSS